MNGILTVSQSSDGIRDMLALVGDTAYRCYQLGSHLGSDAPKRTWGNVMIDEVDVHLHPGWQQAVLSDLSEAFPGLQFIVSTHSPRLVDYIDKLEDGTHDDENGRALRKKLADLYGERHPVMLDTDRLIRFQAFKYMLGEIEKTRWEPHATTIKHFFLPNTD